MPESRRAEMVTLSTSREPGAGKGSSEAATLLDPEGCGAYYRELAGNLRSLDKPPGSVVVAGVGKGVGCSSVCLGLGGALVSMGLRVAVVDCNLERPRLHKMLDEPNFTGLTSALENNGNPEVYAYEPMPGLLVMPTGPIPEPPSPGVEFGGVIDLVSRLREGCDVVLLDTPGSQEVRISPELLKGFEGILLVIHASRTSRDVAREAADGLSDAGANLLGVVLNGRP